MKRRSRYLVFALFLLVLLTVQTIQADLTNTNNAHMDDNSDWSSWIGGGNKQRTCKPCHAYWNLSTTGNASKWAGPDSYYDVDTLVVNTPSRILNNCVDCHTYGYPDMSANIDPNLPTGLAASVHGSLEKKCLSCHTIYHSGHQTVGEETVNGDVYTTCDSGCHQIAANLDDIAAGYAVTAGDRAFMRIYAIDSPVPTYKPTPASTFVRKLYNSSSASPFGEQRQNMYNAYLDPWNKDPSLIASTARYKICFNCHFITTNPAEAEAAVISDSSGTKYIPIPEEVFSVIGDAHSIGSLKDYNLDGEDIGVEKRNNDVQITYILPFVTVAIIVLILVSSRRRDT